MRGPMHAAGRGLFVLVTVVAVILAAEQGLRRAEAADPCLGGPDCWALFPLQDGLQLPLYASHALDAPAPQIRRAVIVVHGIRRNAHQYFPMITAAAAIEGLRSQTLVLAPSFSIASDDRPHRRPGEVYWAGNRNWRHGDASVSLPPGRISSFGAVERLLSHLGDRRLFPNLDRITLAGHSAGGQFVQRFAVGHAPLAALSSVRLRYVVANPGTYLYLGPERPGPDFDGDFAVPSGADCAKYDRYQYGLGQLNGFMARAGKDILRARAQDRDVVLLLGRNDSDPDHETLNRKCAAALQGRHRLERGRLFKAHLDRLFGRHGTRIVEVPGVGHEGAEMFAAPEGRRAVFY
ncbi:hypothetical protein [Pelagibius sp.]|uniref:hypothetical protein n=1 Tax=Pelagibius sp. TaxID=1931238 RepID=UPI003B509837